MTGYETFSLYQALKLHFTQESYDFFKYNGKMNDIKDFNPDILDILSREVLKMIQDNEEGWEDMLPDGVADIIKDQRLFGYTKRRKQK